MYMRGGPAVSEAGSVDFRAASTCSSSWVSFGPFSRATWSNSARSASAQASSGTGLPSVVACGLRSASSRRKRGRTDSPRLRP